MLLNSRKSSAAKKNSKICSLKIAGEKMTQDKISLLLGASISLVASLLTIIVTGVIQFIRDARTRKWQLKDHEDEIVRQLMAHRIDELETFTKEIVISISSINSELPHMLEAGNEEKLISYCQKILNDFIIPQSAKAEHYLSLSLYFHNEILFERFRTILHTLTYLSRIITKIVRTLVEKKSLDYQEVKKDLEKISILEPYGTLLLTFDLIRSNPDKLFTTLKNKEVDKKIP